MQQQIRIRGAREHNLKNIDVDLPRDSLVVMTGLSGSGKSSLAFDTIYAEGQRRYVESLSAYARQFLELMQKPEVESIEGLSPAISIEQKTTSRNPRSTVATVTEIYDYMRLLWARVGVPYSPATGLPIVSQTVSQMVDRVMAMPEGDTALSAGADRARAQGRVPQGVDRPQKARLSAGQDRRQDGRARRGPAAQQESEARHRGGRRPHRRRRPISATGSPIRSKPHSTSPTASPSPRTPIRARRRSFRRNSPARSRALRSPRSSRGCSRSTIRSAPARPATGSAPSSISIPAWSSTTSAAASPRVRSARGRIPRRNTTRRPWRASPATSGRACTRRGANCRKRCGKRSCRARTASRSR